MSVLIKFKRHSLIYTQRANVFYAAWWNTSNRDPSFDKEKLAETAAYLKGLTPMVAADYVKILPARYFFEPPEPFPLKYSENGFADAVPQSLLQFFHKKTENAMHELSEVQVHQINQKVAYLKKRIFAAAALTAGGLLGAVQSGGYTLPLALLAAFQGYKSFAEYQRQKRENPAFFLWKVLRGSRRTGPPAPKGQRRSRGRRVYPGPS